MSWFEVLSFALALGLASSAHCAGMCGVFAIKAAAAPGRLSFALYILGKVFTYCFIGALAGSFGARVIRDSVAIRGYAGLTAAIFLVAAGVMALLPGRAIAPWSRQVTSWLSPLFASIRHIEGNWGRFALGAVTGLLPCGVVYLAGVQAALAGSPVKAVALMGILGLATTPSLLLVAFLSEKIGGRFGKGHVRFAGAVLLLLLGAVTAWRALAPLLIDSGNPAACCH